ncbi:MAG: gamma-glutamyl-gamma-aminobutyrate hydrolase family protein, partial [Planctomycetaceae bacterium]|nr:gamma-glutamyl-gamma-aminobutyrate hydrolase family protein [Planctomycetaceae bacterium]
GGTMRLGAQPCTLEAGSLAQECYQAELVSERHRHRYEFNPAYRERLIAAGMRPTGTNPNNTLVEVVEVADHPWFLAVQYHPEFKSKPLAPHPLFKGFVGAAIRKHRGES